MARVRLTQDNVLIGNKTRRIGSEVEVCEVLAEALFEARKAVYADSGKPTPTPDEIRGRRNNLVGR